MEQYEIINIITQPEETTWNIIMNVTSGYARYYNTDLDLDRVRFVEVGRRKNHAA